MFVHESRGAELNAIRTAMANIISRGARTIQLLGTVGSGLGPSELDPLIRECPTPIFGGLFPMILQGGQAVSDGFTIIGHTDPARIATVELNDQAPELGTWPSDLDDARSVIAFYDASSSAANLVRALFQHQPRRLTWCGGGAGGLDFKPRPVIITPTGLRSSVMVMAGFNAAMRVGVAHGWHAFGAPLLITESDGHDIVSMDWSPAFDVYRTTVLDGAGVEIAADNFFADASRFPLILETFGGEGVVRDPLETLTDRSIRCAGDIPIHSTVRVATATTDAMVSAARSALGAALAHPPVEGEPDVIAFDCISRALLMKDDFAREVAALAVAGRPVVGALTIGELAGHADSLLKIHNKTTVVARFLPGKAHA